jgi:hypothetical protein
MMMVDLHTTTRTVTGISDPLDISFVCSFLFMM